MKSGWWKILSPKLPVHAEDKRLGQAVLSLLSRIHVFVILIKKTSMREFL